MKKAVLFIVVLIVCLSSILTAYAAGVEVFFSNPWGSLKTAVDDWKLGKKKTTKYGVTDIITYTIDKGIKVECYFVNDCLRGACITVETKSKEKERQYQMMIRDFKEYYGTNYTDLDIRSVEMFLRDGYDSVFMIADYKVLKKYNATSFAGYNEHTKALVIANKTYDYKIFLFSLVSE